MKTKNSKKFAEGYYPHETIIVGWNDGKVVYCRTFNDQTDRHNMFKAYDYVSEYCDHCVMTSRLDETINNPYLMSQES